VDLSPFTTPEVIRQVSLICRSYRLLLGEELLKCPANEGLTQAIFDAPFVVVSHDTAPDPRFNFGNRQALELWEMAWSDFVGLPSRYSAEEGHREERARLLREVAEKGFSRNYQGIRASQHGRRFRIEGATVFNLVDAEGRPSGQAATFSTWTFL
jgi:hypothetical protein